MKNSILGKARWLREVALATSKNNGARVAREWLKYAAMFVMLFTIGIGNVWGAIDANSTWTATAFGDLSENATVIILNNFGRAIPNADATSGGPLKVAASYNSTTKVISVSTDGKFLKDIAWTVKKTTNGTKFYVYGSSTKTLGLSGTNSNSAVRVNSGLTYTEFVMGSNGYLLKYYNAARYVGEYVSGSDWRSYNSETASNYKSGDTQQTLTFYVLDAGGGSTPSVTPDPTSLDWGTVLQGSSQEKKTISITGANLMEGSLTISATGGYSVTPTSQNVNGTLDATDLTVTPPSTSTTGEKNGKVTISGGGLASNVEIDLSMTVNAASTVTWMNNGSEYTTTLVANGAKPEFPSNPSSCDGTSTTFYGWSTSEWSGKIDDISAKTIYTSAASMPTVSGAITYYAVFCKGGGGSEVLNEKFDDEQTSDASSAFSSTTFSNFNGETSKAYKSKYGGVKFGTSSAVGYITSKSLDLSKAFTVSIDACKYGSDAGNIEVTVGSTTKTISNSSLDAQGSFKTFVLEFDAATSTSTVKIGTSSKRAYIDNVVITTAGTASQYLTTCQACVAPTSVTITGTNKYLGGQTISLTAAPEGGTGTPSYQWQKKISGVWRNLANDGSISGVASNNLQISSCTHANSGGYRCIVSTGDGCETKSHADGTDGYGVHVFSIHGKYTTDADYSDTEIIWTSETTGTATISMDAKKTYLFKVWSNNGYYYGHGANTNEDFMFQPTTWDCGVNNNEMRLFTTVAGNYTFTVNIEHGLDGSPYVNVQVGYPSMTHPNSGYVYVQKFNWQPYLHYWYDNSHPLSTWGSDPQLAANQYTSICGTDYWCVPVIDYYCNFIAKDAAGDPSNTTGDQHTNSPRPGQRLYNDGSWKWGEFSTYTITYAGGDGSTGGPMASHTGLCPGSSQQLTVNAFSKAYHTFNGWSDGNGHTYADQAMIENIQSNINLTAQWTKTPVEELLLNYSELNKYVDDPAVTLEVTGVTPEGADASVTWSSSNSSVASVVAATGVVTFGTVGTATITATSTVTGTTTAYCHVTVRNKPTATFVDLIHDGNGTDLSTYNMQNVAGTAIVFPTLDDYATPGDDCDTKHYVFVGWTTSDNNDDPQDHLVASGELEDGQDKVFYAVWADGVEGVSYTKLTTNSFKTSPTKYVIGAEYNGDTYYFYNCAATDANNGNGGCTTSPATNAPIQFTLSGTADALVATSTEAPARYLTPLTGNNFQMSATTKTIALSKNGDILNASTTTWALRFNTSNKYLRWYNTAPGSAAYFYEVTAGAAVSYRTSCCTNNVPAPTVIATNTAYTVTLTWGAVDGATGYEVSWNGGAFTAATSPCVKSGLTASTDYIYKVRATYDPLVKCGALVASGNVTTDDVYSVTYSGGTGTGSCSPSGSVAPVSYEAGATVTLAPTNSFSMTSNTFAAWVVKDADDNVIPVSNNQFTMPAKNVTVTATWTAVQDKYYDRMHDGTDALHGGIADGEGKYYLVLEGCNYTVPALTDDAEGDTDCHTTHFKLLGWIAQSHLKADGQIKPGEESYIFQGGGTKSATGATYYAIWAIMTE